MKRDTPNDSAFPSPGPCACYGDERMCECANNERALRNYSMEELMPPMTDEQRAFCLNEINGVEGYDANEYIGADDRDLANATLAAWRDYCRDKGFAV